MVLVPGGCKWSSCTHSQLLVHSWWFLEPARDHNSVVYLRKVPTNQGSTRMTQKMVKISPGREIGAAKMAQVGRPRKWILSQPWFLSRNLLECLLRSIVLLFTNVSFKNLLNHLLRELYLVQFTKIVWAESGKSLKKFLFGKKNWKNLWYFNLAGLFDPKRRLNNQETYFSDSGSFAIREKKEDKRNYFPGVLTGWHVCALSAGATSYCSYRYIPSLLLCA